MWNQSSLSNPCPVCGRDFDGKCSISENKITVLCKTRITPSDEIPTPPDHVGEYVFNGKTLQGVFERAIYTRQFNPTVPIQKDNAMKNMIQHYVYVDCNTKPGEESRILRTCRKSSPNGDKRIWQEYWIEDERLARFRPKVNGHGPEYWITVTEKMVKRGEASPDERAIYLNAVEMLKPRIHLFNVESAKKLAAEQNLPLFIVEGEQVVQDLTAIGIPAITSVGGAGKWGQYGGAFGNYVNDLMGTYQVVLSPDSDLPGVRHFLEVADSLDKVKCLIGWCYAFGNNEVWNDVESAQKGLDLSDQIRHYRQSGLYDEQIKEAIIASINGIKAITLPQRQTTQIQMTFRADESDDDGDADAKPKPKRGKAKQTEAPPVQTWSTEPQDIGQPDEKGKRSRPQQSTAANAFAHQFTDKYIYCSEHQIWYAYSYEFEGVWSQIKEDEFRMLVQSWLTDKLAELGFSASYLAGICALLKSHAQLFKARWVSNDYVIPFRNGVYNLMANTFVVGHRPDNYLTYVLPRDYDPLVTDDRSIQDWLHFVFSGCQKTIERFECMAAMMLKRIYGMQKFIHLQGVPGAGKSKALELLTELIGKDNSAPSTLERIATNRFDIAKFIDKQLCLLSDQGDWAGSIDTFLNMTGNDAVTYERKSKDPGSFIYKGFVCMSSNGPVFLGRQGKEVTRRQHLFQFRNPVTKPDPNFLEKLKAGLTGWTNRLLRIPDNRIREVLYIDVNGLSADQWESKLRTDSLAGWLEDNCVFSPTISHSIGSNKADLSTLFGNYYQYVEQSGSKPRGLKEFSATLLSTLEQVLPNGDFKYVKTARCRLIKGLALRESGAVGKSLDQYMRELNPDYMPTTDRIETEELALPVPESPLVSDALTAETNQLLLSDTTLNPYSLPTLDFSVESVSTQPIESDQKRESKKSSKRSTRDRGANKEIETEVMISPDSSDTSTNENAEMPDNNGLQLTSSSDTSASLTRHYDDSIAVVPLTLPIAIGSMVQVTRFDGTVGTGTVINIDPADATPYLVSGDSIYGWFEADKVQLDE